MLPLLHISGLEQHADFLQQQMSKAPAIIVVALRDKLIQTHEVSCLECNMQSRLERARASAPKLTTKRGSSDFPTLENLEEHGDYLLGLLAEDPAINF